MKKCLWVSLALLCMSSAVVLGDEIKIESKTLSVIVDSEFPRIIQYKHKINGESIAGQTTPVSTININGLPTICQVSFSKNGRNSAIYVLTFLEQKIEIELNVTVGDDTVTMQVTKVTERGDTKLMNFEFPGNALLEINSSQKDAAIAATVSTNLKDHHATRRDAMKFLSEMKPQADTGNYLFLSADNLAAGIANNHVVDIQRTAWEVTDKNGVATLRAWRPLWQYREITSETVGYPNVKVFITSDRNDDGKATWQDAALVYRNNMPMPYGHKFVRTSVGCQVAMNFASGAQQPFLRILDAIKKINLATDGIGQEVLIKGFSAEGHDSANTDYGGHYNERAGGLKDLNYLFLHAKKYNARVGIHINASEVYPEAHRYNPEILERDKNGNPSNGWLWLDRAHLIDKHKDILTGNLFNALDVMHTEMPDLDYVYVDTYWENGWKAWKIAMKLNSMGLPMYTEGNTPLDPWTTWSHWRNGKPSPIMQFIWYSHRDLYANDPILRVAGKKGFLSWQREFNFYHYIKTLFAENLPAKYLQNFELLRYEPGSQAIFSDGVKVTKNGNSVTVTRHDRKIMSWTGGGTNSRLFVPWNPKSEDKIYVWDDLGGVANWELPPSWKNPTKVYLYKLSDMGRSHETIIVATNGMISLQVEKGVPYVIYPEKAPKQKPLNWGEGRIVKDAGFDSHSFDYWTVNSPDNVKIENDNNGNARLMIMESACPHAGVTTISQKITGLKGGTTYAASVWVQVEGERLASLELLPLGNPDAIVSSNYVERTTVKHGMPCDQRTGSNYQRLKVLVDIPKGCSSVLLTMKAAKNSDGSKVEFDDIRIVETKRTAAAEKHWFYEDFENVDMGYGPFTCCFGERTHLSESNPPYTKDTINGRFSFKTRDGGRAVRTLPCTIRFKPWTKYKLTCATLGGEGRITAESAGEIVLDGKIESGSNRFESEFSTLNDTESFISIYKGKGDWLTLDDITIDEIGIVPASARRGITNILKNDS